jgi:hypothetical protein
MTMRMMVALSATLMLAGSTLAQEPVKDWPTPPAYMTPEAPPLSIPAPAAAEGSARFWVTSDYWAAWVNGARLPALVTTSPTGTARPVAGVLGQPTTATLFGGEVVNDDIRSGLRLGFGYWLGAERNFGVEAGFSMLESQASLFSGTSSQFPILARPFTDARNFSQQAVLAAFPGFTTGSIAARASSGNFYEGHIDFAVKLVDGPGPAQLDGLIGYRYYRFDEGIRIQQSLSPTSTNFIAGTLIQTQDDFGSRNEFHGFDVGVRPRFVWQSLSVDLLAKIAVGDLHHVVNIRGSQVITVPGTPPIAQTGGVFALGTNIGSFPSNELAVLPEFGATLGWRVTSTIKVRVGYSLLMLNEVARAGDQVNTTINPNRFPGVTGPQGSLNEPAFYLNRTNTWVHGATVGLEWSY